MLGSMQLGREQELWVASKVLLLYLGEAFVCMSLNVAYNIFYKVGHYLSINL